VRAFVLSISFLTVSSVLYAQETEQHISNGNSFYRNKQYKESEAEYQKALEKTPQQPVARYNYASSLFRNDNGTKAMSLFDSMARASDNLKIRTQSYYNNGSMLSQQFEKAKEANKKLGTNSQMLDQVSMGLLVKSIDYYKNTLRQNPADTQARENLQKALIELKNNQPPPEKKEDKKKKEEKKKEQRPKMNQKEVEQRLKLMEQKEKEVQQRVQKQKVKAPAPVSKDW
jgi:Ca-activated chloride channel homolog